MKSGGGNVFLRAMQRKSLGSELGRELLDSIENPINFKPLTQDLGHGYETARALQKTGAVTVRKGIICVGKESRHDVRGVQPQTPTEKARVSARAS
jgi:hypothetical protein